MLADGFEEIEAVTIIDILRRAGVSVTIAGVGGKDRAGSHGVRIAADASLSEISGKDFDAVILPGGMPGTTNLRASSELRELLLRHHREGRIVAAICAAPWVLADAGILEGRSATCYPGLESKLSGAKVCKDRVVVDGNVISSRGPATAIDFSLKLAEILAGAKKAAELRAALLAGS